MDETINIQEVSNSVTENISTINDELNLIVTLTGLSITAVFFALYFTKLRSKQLLNYVPNVWTSLGILGTFIAIVVSLDSSGTNSLSDVDTLVKNIIPAFTTSIIGIIGAVVCSVAIKIIYAYEEKEEDEFYRRTVGNEKFERYKSIIVTVDKGFPKSRSEYKIVFEQLYTPIRRIL